MRRGSRELGFGVTGLREFCEGVHVFVGCVADDLTAGSDDPMWAGLCVKFFERQFDLEGRTVAEIGKRIQIPGKHLMRSHYGARFVHRHREIEIDHFTAEVGHAIEDAAGVSADMEAHFAAGGVDGIDQLFFPGPDELFVDARADEGGSRVTNADDVGAGSDLRGSEADGGFDGEGKQIMDEWGIVGEVHHEPIDAAEVGGFGTGTFDPAFKKELVCDAMAKQLDAANAIFHAAAGEWMRAFGVGERRLVGEECFCFDDSGRLIVVPAGRCAGVGGFAGGIGDDGDVVKAEEFGGLDLGVGEDAVIAGVVAIAHAEDVGGEHHGDGHDRDVVGSISI